MASLFNNLLQCLLVGFLAVVAVIVVTWFLSTAVEINSSDNQASDVHMIVIGGEIKFQTNIASAHIHQKNRNEILDLTKLSRPISYFGNAIDDVNNVIYVVGGFAGPNRSSTFWSFDVSTATWNTDMPPFPYKVAGNTAVVFNGKLFSFGGFTQNNQLVKNALAYDLQSGSIGTWQLLPTLPGANNNDGACAVVVKNKSIYYIGVSRPNKQNQSDAHRSDDGARSWTKVSSMSVGRKFAACVAVWTTTNNQQILVAGGLSGNESVNSVEIYDIATDTWTLTAPMAYARSGAVGVAMPLAGDEKGQNILVCGGHIYHDEKDSTYYELCEEYDWSKGAWIRSNSSNLSMARSHFGMFMVENDLRRGKNAASAKVFSFIVAVFLLSFTLTMLAESSFAVI